MAVYVVHGRILASIVMSAGLWTGVNGAQTYLSGKSLNPSHGPPKRSAYKAGTTSIPQL